MNEQQEETLKNQAKQFMANPIGRTSEEKQAYLSGVEDALIAAFSRTMQGAYPAHHALNILEEIIYPES